MRIGRYSFYQNDFFKLSRKPFVLGISGDSGSGKDNLVNLMVKLFGKNSVTSISGDDYHLWDRKKPMWKILTHLNPVANNLEQLAHDTINLINGKSILKKKYDHKTGRMSLPENIKSNDIIIISGLHALYLPILRKCYDLSIFVEMDEKMRKFLKIRRDSNKRGHSVNDVKSSLKKRAKDSEIYIKPQAKKADLIISLHPIDLDFNDKIDFSKLKYRLIITSRNWLSEVSLSRALIGLSGLNVEMKELNDSDQFVLTIEGEPSEKDIELSAKLVCPKTIQFLDIKPKWEAGVQGLIQLITLVHIDQVLTKKMV
jgi:uridine kinase